MIYMKAMDKISPPHSLPASAMPDSSLKSEARPAMPLASLPGIEHLSVPELDKLEHAFKNRADKAKRPQHKVSRLRLWLLFILLRHAALRLARAR